MEEMELKIDGNGMNFTNCHSDNGKNAEKGSELSLDWVGGRGKGDDKAVETGGVYNPKHTG